MRQPRILCVPNFSEGRRAGTIDALARAVGRVRGVILLDQHTDPDHHRTVLTFAGPPASVAEAAFEAARVASRLIDLRGHRGGHPRIGATDVIPLVPLGQVSMRQCVTVARALGRRIGRELTIPVFLYEQAASRPARRRLEAIRRGGLEGLARRMADDPSWRPDFGPNHLHPSAGATVVGARPPLIAFNVNLASRDLESAREIAGRIRASGGGLPGVKALGVELGSRGLVQVSTNVTDFHETPVQRVFSTVQEEAVRRGLPVESSEVIGLIPAEAIAQVAQHQLKLERFSVDRILEVRLERRLSALSPAQALAAEAAFGTRGAQAGSAAAFLRAVGGATPTPGSGSVAALVAASAAALGVKACEVTMRATTGRREPARHLRARLKRLEVLRARLERLMEADPLAYEAVIGARRDEHGGLGGERRLLRALRRAVEVPLDIADAALRTATELRGVASAAKRSVVPDARVGRDLAVAACRSALKIAEWNIKSIKKQRVMGLLRDRVGKLRESLVVARGL